MLRLGSRLLSPARVLLLAATLLLAQWIMVQHETDLAAHADHACEWRLAHAPVAAGPASSPIVLLVLLVYVAPVSTSTSPLTAGSSAAYQTRAPPFSFSV